MVVVRVEEVRVKGLVEVIRQAVRVAGSEATQRW